MTKTRPTDWTPRKRSQVLALARLGSLSIRKISQELSVPKSTVYDIATRGTPDNELRSGRPGILSARDLRRIDRYIKRDKDSRRQPPELVIKGLGLRCSVMTLKRAIKTLGYTRSVARKRPLLKKLDYKRRLTFAKAHKHWTVEDWKRVIFTDEASFKIGMDRLNVTYVWRKPGEEYHKDCIEDKKRSTGTGMMFWGSFRIGKVGPGKFFMLEKNQRITSLVYRDQILLGPLTDFYNESRVEILEPIIMEDNAPVHKGHCVVERKRLNWPEYSHPPNSPDLNPIENIWAHMKRVITTKHRYVSSKKEMMRVIQEVWDNYTDTQWDNLIASMPRRMLAVIKAKGGPTRY
jgi:transposase